MTFVTHMDSALREAQAAGQRGEVPVGAVVVAPDGRIVASAGNRTRELRDPTAHAEMLVLRAACASVRSERLANHSLWVTLEPCPMCAAAIGFARIGRLYFGAADRKSGGVLHGPRIYAFSQAHHVPEVYDGIGADESSALLRDFFASLRKS
jgi:tRNA(adenine34) deaminase